MGCLAGRVTIDNVTSILEGKPFMFKIALRGLAATSLIAITASGVLANTQTTALSASHANPAATIQLAQHGTPDATQSPGGTGQGGMGQGGMGQGGMGMGRGGTM